MRGSQSSRGERASGDSEAAAKEVTDGRTGSHTVEQDKRRAHRQKARLRRPSLTWSLELKLQVVVN